MTADNIVFSILATGVSAFIVLRVIPSYLDNRKRKIEAEQKRAEKRASQSEAERKERDRKESLQKNDPDVDQIVLELIRAKFSIQNTLKNIDEFNVTPENMAQLIKWSQDHQGVMDFHVFKEIIKYFPQPNEEPFLLKEEIEQLLEEHCDAEPCLGYADEKLGIQRGYELRDGETCGGLYYEKTNGRYEHIDARFKRILKKHRETERL